MMIRKLNAVFKEWFGFNKSVHIMNTVLTNYLFD